MRWMRSIVRIAVLMCMAGPLFGGSGARVTVSNPSEVSRKSETVEVRITDLLVCDSLLEKGQVRVTEESTGEELVSQRADGYLLFQSDFAPRETKTFLVMRAPLEKGIISKVDGYFARPREDYAWENDRIAFRMYGPALAAEVNNGIDVWTKRVRDLIVRKWYAADEKSGTGTSYHVDRGEGADFFAVGKSLGAGGSGIWYKGNLYQPGVFSSYKTLTNGPIRVAFELTYATWDIGGKKFTERERITLDAGQNLNKINVLFTGLDPGDSMWVACGLVKRMGVTVRVDTKRGLATLWGSTNDDPVNGWLGTGVVMPSGVVAGAHEDSSQVLMFGRLRAGEPFSYLAGAGWTRSGDFSDGASWGTYIREAAVALTRSLHVAVAPCGK
jgi:hypothetical protein